MVFMGQRRAENRHETVAGELRHGPVVAPHLGDRDFEKAVDEIAHRLGAEPLGQGGRADDVAEQYADLLHLADMRGRGSQARRRQRRFGETRRAVSVERRGTAAAKPVFRRIGGAAGRARGTQRRRALSAEPHAGGILGVTPRASHAGPPRCDGILRRRRFKHSGCPPRLASFADRLAPGNPPVRPATAKSSLCEAAHIAAQHGVISHLATVMYRQKTVRRPS